MKLKNTKIWVIILIGLGILIRLYQYLVNRSLYHDEALLARNINDLSFSELTGILEFNQAAPFGFLWLTKLVVNIFGDIEYAFRLLPLLGGIASIFLFYKVLKYFLTPPFLIIALAFFVFNNQLIFYSISFKQYGIDVFVGLLICLGFLRSLSSVSHRLNGGSESELNPPFKRWVDSLLFGFTGAILIYFSQPSVFFLASAGLILIFKHLKNKDWDKFKKLTFSGILWVLSFVIYFFIFLRPTLVSDFLQNYHTQYNMPVTFWKSESWSWYFENFVGIFGNPGDIHFNILGAIFGLIGIIFGIWIKEEKHLFLLLPIFFAFGASAFGKYSVIPRLMLFAVPALIIFLVKGIEIFYQKLNDFSPKFSMPITLILSGLLILQSFLNSAVHQTAKPKRIENIKALLSHIESEKQPDDILYLYFHSEAQFGYYKNKYDLQNLETIYGRNPYDKLWESDFENLKNKGRVWVLMTHYKRLDGTLDNQIYAQKLNEICTKIDEKNEVGGVVFLYNCFE